jgi:small GTP-binding protein
MEGSVRCRVVAIGNESVGKTSIINRLIDDGFDSAEQPTVGADWQLFVHTVDCDRVELQIWDTAGQEKFRSLGPLYYRDAVAAVAVFDVTNRASFDELGWWVSEFVGVAVAHAVVVVAANKCDLEDEKVVTEAQARDWAAQRGFMLYETSAKTGQNILQMFRALAESAAHLQTAAPGGGRESSDGQRCC